MWSGVPQPWLLKEFYQHLRLKISATWPVFCNDVFDWLYANELTILTEAYQTLINVGATVKLTIDPVGTP